MRLSTSVSDIRDFFLRTENELNLLAWSYNNVFLWREVRVRIYYRLSQSLKLFESPHTFEKKPFLSRLPRFVWNHRRQSPQNGFIGIVPSPRLIDGKDPISHGLLSEIGENALVFGNSATCTAIENLGLGCDTFKSDFLDFFTSVLVKVTTRLWPTPAPLKKLAFDLDSRVQNEFDVSLKTLRILETYYYRFRIERYLLRRTFSKFRIKKLFIVCAYYKNAYAAAAQDLNIPVIELQHGVMTKYHLGYAFPNTENVPYFPDHILCFGRFWAEKSELPKNTKTTVTGAPHIRSLARLDRPIKRGGIVFTSQGVIGSFLFEFARAVAKKLPNEKIIFRLHPNETLEKYRDLIQDSKLPTNFSVSHKTPNIFQLLAGAEYQAGVFSTTLFEGLTLGCKTIIVVGPGAEYCEDLVTEGDAIQVETVEEFVERYQSARVSVDVSKYYADSPKSILSAIEDTLNQSNK